MIRRCAILAALVSGLTMSAEARLIVNENTEYFDVTGVDARTLMRSIRRQTGDTSLANTIGQIGIVYKIRRDGEHCRLHDVRVSLGITVALPRWEQRDEAPEYLGTRFDRMVEALRGHESGHVRLFRQQANQLEMALQTLKRPCMTIDAVARQLPAVYEREYRVYQENYDRDSRGVENPEHFTLF